MCGTMKKHWALLVSQFQDSGELSDCTPTENAGTADWSWWLACWAHNPGPSTETMLRYACTQSALAETGIKTKRATEKA